MSLPAFKAASLVVEANVAEFVHQRPQARNPLGAELREDYIRLLDLVEKDKSVRVLILRGAGGSFSAGGDVREMVARLDNPQAHTPEVTRRRVDSANAWLARLLELDAIVIAAVDGAAFGGGFSLALHADIVLASPEARFSMSFPRIGAVPDFGAHYLLPRIVGLGVARGLMLTGRSVGAKAARRLGIVHAIHPAADLPQRARDTARLFCEGPAEVLATNKRLLNRSHSTDYRTLGQLEAQSQGIAMASAYHRDAARRFRDRQSLAFDWDRNGGPLGFDFDD